MLCRKLKYFHHCWGYMWGLRVNLCWFKKPDASWVSVGVPPMAKRDQQDMTVGEWEEGNKMSLHMVVDIEVHHKCVTCGRKG